VVLFWSQLLCGSDNFVAVAVADSDCDCDCGVAAVVAYVVVVVVVVVCYCCLLGNVSLTRFVANLASTSLASLMRFA